MVRRRRGGWRGSRAAQQFRSKAKVAWLPPTVFAAALCVVVPRTGLLRRERHGATRWARGMALLALAAYLGVAVWGSLTKWPPTLAMVLSVAFLWGAGVLLIWTTLLSSRHISEVGLGASVLLLGSSFLLLGSASLLTGGDPWLNLLGVVFLVSGIGGVLYAIGVLLGRAALRGVGFVIFGVSGLLFGAGTLLMTGAIMLGIGFLILGFGVLLHGASLLPDRLRAAGLR
jgi:hypothetical protein